MNKSDTIAIIRSLLSSTNSSYSIYRLSKDFKNETGVDIPLFGYSNITDFLNSIPDTVKMTGIYPIQQISLVTNDKSAHIASLVKRQRKNESKKKFLSINTLHSRKAEVNARFETEEIKEYRRVVKKGDCGNLKNINYPNSDKLIFLRNLPRMTESIPAINARLHIRVGEYVEVCPCWIFRPDKFYFRLRKFKNKFDKFTKKLQIFYAANEEIPYVAHHMIKPKQPCAVFYKIFSEPKWHRGEIQEISKNSQVIVSFVDYGCNREVSRDSIKYLDQNFQSFPKQAILGSLANIKPLQGQSEWSEESIRLFHDLAFEKDLVGGVVYINNKNNGIGMALSSTGSSEIHINDTLVKEGFAAFNMNVLSWDFGGVSIHSSLLEKNPNFNNIKDIQRPIRFFTNDHCINKRLRKMFSVVEEK